MATISERLAYILTFDTTSGVRSLEKMGSTADKELGKVDKRLDKLGVGMQKFGAGALAAAGLAGAGLYKLAGAGSDLEESVNALKVTFGDAAGGMKKLGEEAARSLGLSKTEFNGLAVQFSSFAQAVAGPGGDVVKTMDDITTRASDFASVMNLEVADAARIFQSGLAGETEPLKKFGIDLSAAAVGAYAVSHGLAESANAMSESEKVTARYGLLMEQTAKMQGDFANTSDGAANQQRILKAELGNLAADIGAGVLPVFTKLVSTATSLTGAFSSLSPEAKSALGTIAVGATGLLAFAGTASLIIGKLITMRDTFEEAGISTRVMAGAAGAAGIALLGMSLQAAKSAREAGRAADAIDDLTRASDANLIKEFGDALVKGAIAGDDLDDSLANITRTSPGAIQRMLDLEEASGDVTEQMLAQGFSTEEAAEWLDKMRKALDNETTALENAAATQEAATAATEEGTVAIEEQASSVDELRAKHEANTAALKRAEQQQEDMNSAVLAGLDSSLGYRNAQAKAGEAIVLLSKQQDDSEISASELAQTQRDAEGAILGSAAAAVQLAEDQAAANGVTLTAEQKAAKYKEELQRMSGFLSGDLAAAIQGYIDDLNRIPSTVSTSVNLSKPVPGRSSGNAKGSVRAFAEGGIVRATPGGEFINVAEGGHDEAIIPLSGPHAPKLSAGVTNIFNVTVNALDPTDRVGRVVTDSLRAFVRNGGRPPWS